MSKVSTLLGSVLGCPGKAGDREGTAAWPELRCLWGQKEKWGSHRHLCGSNQECTCQGSRALGDIQTLYTSAWKRYTFVFIPPHPQPC